MKLDGFDDWFQYAAIAVIAVILLGSIVYVVYTGSAHP